MRIELKRGASCDMCNVNRHSDGRSSGFFILQFPTTFTPRWGTTHQICFCKHHLQLFLNAMGMSEGYDVDTIQSDTFADPDVREAIFGSQENYTAFVRLALGNVRRFGSYDTYIKDAVDIKDWRRAIKIASTYNWDGMDYYELGDHDQEGKKRTLTIEQVENFVDVVYRFNCADPDIKWNFRGENCPVYFTLFNWNTNVSPFLDRSLIYDKYYWVVSTDPTAASTASDRIRMMENLSPSQSLTIIEQFTTPLQDVDLKTVTNIMAFYQRNPEFDRTHINRVPKGQKAVSIFASIWWSEIGLRQWSEEELIFDYGV